MATDGKPRSAIARRVFMHQQLPGLLPHESLEFLRNKTYYPKGYQR